MNLLDQLSDDDKALYLEKMNIVYGTKFRTIEEIAEYEIRFMAIGDMRNFTSLKGNPKNLEAKAWKKDGNRYMNRRK